MAEGAPYGLVIFDCDGVLVDSEPIANRVFAEMLAELGLPLGYEETVRTFVGRSMPACVAIVEERIGRPVPAGFTDDFRERTFAAFRRQLRPVAGVEQALDAIALPTCVASSGEPAKIRFTLGLTGLLPRFEGRIFSSVEVERGKPAPDLFLHAARRMGVTPERCAVVEDSVLSAQAGAAAGMTVLGYAERTDAAALAAAGASRVFTGMRALPALLAGPAA
ncbi:MAG TPA: HAD family hydrolase [Longimicrobium sp.]|nr:HAD family hydrolase [Longimicrobium sp.]